MANLSNAEKHGKQKGSIAEEFHLTQEAKFKGPTLEELYWDKPNSSKGQIARCTYGEYGVKSEVKYREGL